jgi:hypothetical protein
MLSVNNLNTRLDEAINSMNARMDAFEKRITEMVTLKIVEAVNMLQSRILSMFMPDLTMQQQQQQQQSRPPIQPQLSATMPCEVMTTLAQPLQQQEISTPASASIQAPSTVVPQTSQMDLSFAWPQALMALNMMGQRGGGLMTAPLSLNAPYLPRTNHAYA